MESDEFLVISILAPVSAMILIGTLLYVKRSWTNLTIEMMRSGKFDLNL